VVDEAPMEVEGIFFEVGVDFSGDPPLPTASISRIAIYDGEAP
jgi:hypothetical protein